MGKRGPKPLPDNVRALRGTAVSRPIGELRDGVQPRVEVPAPPKYLLPEAKVHWKFITPLLEELGLVAQIDRVALELYCQEYAWYVRYDKAYQDDRLRIAEARAAWEADPANKHRPWTGGDGTMIPTGNGSLMYNPNWVARKQASTQVDRYLNNFGLSPSARSRVQTSDNYPYLPGMEPPASAPAAPATASISTLADFVRPQ